MLLETKCQIWIQFPGANDPIRSSIRVGYDDSTQTFGEMVNGEFTFRSYHFHGEEPPDWAVQMDIDHLLMTTPENLFWDINNGPDTKAFIWNTSDPLIWSDRDEMLRVIHSLDMYSPDVRD